MLGPDLWPRLGIIIYPDQMRYISNGKREMRRKKFLCGTHTDNVWRMVESHPCPRDGSKTGPVLVSCVVSCKACTQ